ncbi:MAG: hypothetical protein M0Z75_00965 [Nitrospiraceae bacterium]|nr:hypothetical protein [Nitrospiraceae bacterium]
MNGLELLIFTVGGTVIGVDRQQVYGIITKEQAEEMEMDVIPLHRIIPFGRKSIHYRCPRALLLKNDPSRALLIESPDDIIQAGIDSIRCLPPALAACNPVKAIWGVAMTGERAAVLVDLDKLDITAGSQNRHIGFEQKISTKNTGAIL